MFKFRHKGRIYFSEPDALIAFPYHFQLTALVASLPSSAHMLLAYYKEPLFYFIVHGEFRTRPLRLKSMIHWNIIAQQLALSFMANIYLHVSSRCLSSHDNCSSPQFFPRLKAAKPLPHNAGAQHVHQNIITNADMHISKATPFCVITEACCLEQFSSLFHQYMDHASYGQLWLMALMFHRPSRTAKQPRIEYSHFEHYSRFFSSVDYTDIELHTRYNPSKYAGYKPLNTTHPTSTIRQRPCPSLEL